MPMHREGRTQPPLESESYFAEGDEGQGHGHSHLQDSGHIPGTSPSLYSSFQRQKHRCRESMSNSELREDQETADARPRISKDRQPLSFSRRFCSLEQFQVDKARKP